MTSRGKPRWESLILISLVSGAALELAIRLPFPPTVDAWVLGFWVLFFYSAVAIWITRNREALEREPQPLDCVGRPIFDPDIVESNATEESECNQEGPVIRSTPSSFSRSEVL